MDETHRPSAPERRRGWRPSANLRTG
jgi:hypothetical protein